MKASKYVDETKIKNITTSKRAPSFSINKPWQEFGALNAMFNETFKGRMNLPHKVSSASNLLHSVLSFILVFTYIQV